MPQSRPKAVIILAAGQGKRLLSSLSKVMHPLAGQRVLDYSLSLAQALKPAHIVLVIPPGKNPIQAHLAAHYPKIKIAVQKEAKGTGHALMQAAPLFKRFKGDILILYGDVPLLRRTTIDSFYRHYLQSQASLAMMTTHLKNPNGYGRIVRNIEGLFEKIVEDKDTDALTKSVHEVNCGIYWANADSLFTGLGQLPSTNSQGEYYLTDLPELLPKVETWLLKDANEMLGINTRRQLGEAHAILFERSVAQWLERGVTIVDPATTYIEPTVVLSQDCSLEPNCHLRGNTRIGTGTHIRTGAVIDNCRIGSGVEILPYSVLTESRIDDGAQVGPFAHIRPGSHLKQNAKIGNFVEIKKTRLGEGAKANHLSYLGDTAVGSHANIGAGTITCNYDGMSKWKTTIGADAFIGSNSALVAPVRIGQNAVIGAGSVITKTVPKDALAVARERQLNIPHWKSRLKKKRKS